MPFSLWEALSILARAAPPLFLLGIILLIGFFTLVVRMNMGLALSVGDIEYEGPRHPTFLSS